MKLIKFIKRVVKKIYKILFKNKLKIKDLNSKIATLEYQLEYMKRHFDVHQMTPATGWLREYQMQELSFCKEIISLFSSLGIYSFLESGSLIGALRHKGFIPFDDDIDLDVMLDDYLKILEYAKENFVWIDSSSFKGSFLKFEDNAIKNNPDKIVAILTPYCLHLYKGKNLRHCVNAEFFPYAYVNENVSFEQYEKYVKVSIDKVNKAKCWKEIFDFYKHEYFSGEIYSSEKTSKIVPALGHGTFFHQKFRGFFEYDDIFPLKEINFEDSTMIVPANPEKVIGKIYPNWDSFPPDVGISKDLAALNEYLKDVGEIYPWQGC